MVRELADGRGLVKLSVAQTRIVNGDEDLSSWSEAELEYGSKRGKDGRFRKKPRIVAQAVHDELVRRKMHRAYDLLKASTYDAVAALREIVTDDDADKGVRVKAAELILDRVLGKAPLHVDVGINADSKFAKLMASSIVGSVEQAAELLGAVDGEVVEVEGEDVENQASH